MRDVPERRLHPWSPPAYAVDGDGRVVGATPPSPSNWNRWGPTDQRGTANLLTPDRVAAAARLARSGRRFSLALPVGGIRTPAHRPPATHLFDVTTSDAMLGDGRIQYSDEFVMLSTQGTTQLDGLAHVGVDDVLYNGYWAGLVTARSGARRLGIHHLATGIVGRAVLLDVARHLGRPYLDEGFAIGSGLLDAVAEQAGLNIGPGDVVLVRTGHVERFIGLDGADQDRLLETGEPGLAVEVVTWAAERDIAAVGADNIAVEVMPAEPGTTWLDFHLGAVRGLGLQLLELLDLEELAADCAADGVYEGFFVAMPLPLVNGVGAPLNPVFIK